MLEGALDLLKIPKANQPQVIYNLKILEFVKIHYFQQKNHNFFIMEFMKTMIIPMN